jgi:hypothetical protein
VLPGKKGEIFDAQQLTATATAADFLESMKFCNMSMLRGLLIPSLIFGNGDGTGSYSLGQEHSKTFDTLCDSINSGLEHILLQQLVKQIIAYNFPKSQWEEEGLGAFSKRSMSKDEIQKEMEVYTSAITAGIIDANDLNDLNKMRETIGFEALEKPIEHIDPFTGLPQGESPPPGEEADPAEEPKVPGAKPEENASPAEKPKKKLKRWYRFWRKE